MAVQCEQPRHVPLQEQPRAVCKTYFELDNIFNKTYVGSAVPVTDSIADANKQAFFAGYGRAFYAGLTLGF